LISEGKVMKCAYRVTVQVLQFRYYSSGTAVQVLQFRYCSSGTAVQVL
jgi:hypothetical protein